MAIMRNIAYLPETSLTMALSAIELYCLASWLLARSNKSFFGIRTAGVIMCGLENLLAALVHSGRGKSLHMWEQHTDVRETLANQQSQILKLKKAPMGTEVPMRADSRGFSYT